MKKFTLLLFSFVLLLTLTACAPKIKDSIPNIESDNAEQTTKPVYEPYALYFPSTTEKKLIKETQELQVSDTVSEEMRILSALKKGPKGDDLKSPISPDTEITSVKTLSGLCTVNFTENFLNETDSENLSLMIQSIVHSLCQLNTINEVKINVGGKSDVIYNDTVDLTQPLSPDDSYFR